MFWKMVVDDEAPAPNVRALLSAGVSPSITRGGESLLAHCIDRSADPRFKTIVEALLRARADIHDGAPGRTPLSRACGMQNIELVKRLLRLGAEPSSIDLIVVALSATSASRAVPLAKLLLAGGADVQGWTSSGLLSPLIAAAKAGSSALVALFLEHGADVNVRNQRDETALMHACGKLNRRITMSRGFRRDRLRAIQRLLDHGADPTARSERGVDALKAATNSGFPEVIRLKRLTRRPARARRSTMPRSGRLRCRSRWSRCRDLGSRWADLSGHHAAVRAISRNVARRTPCLIEHSPAMRCCDPARRAAACSGILMIFAANADSRSPRIQCVHSRRPCMLPTDPERVHVLVHELLKQCGSDERRAHLLERLYARIPKLRGVGDFTVEERVLLRDFARPIHRNHP
jgi:hypothetical protein